MKSLIVYDSQFGNTKEVARSIAAVLGERGTVQLRAANEMQASDLTGIDLLVMGGPTQAHGLSPALQALFERLPLESLRGLPAAAFDTRLHLFRWLSGSAAGVLAERLAAAGCTLLLPTESFFVGGTEGPLEDGEPARATAWARQVLDHLTFPNLKHVLV